MPLRFPLSPVCVTRRECGLVYLAWLFACSLLGDWMVCMSYNIVAHIAFRRRIAFSISAQSSQPSDRLQRLPRVPCFPYGRNVGHVTNRLACKA